MTPLQKIYLLRIVLGIIAAFLCIGFLTATGSISRNLLLDPSVETGNSEPSYWFSSVNGTEWSTAYAKTGSRSIRINVNNASAEWKSEVTAVQEGDAYQTAGFFKGNVTKDRFSLIVKWFSDSQGHSNITENTISMPIGNYTLWVPIGSAFTAPSGAKSCQIIFKAESASGDLYGDNFEIRKTQSTTVFLNSLSIALVVYLVSYYLIKRRFLLKVEKPQKIATTGIGMYFISWLVFWSLLYTLMATI